MSHYSNSQSDKKQLNQNTVIIGKRYRMIREITIPSKSHPNDSQNWKTYLAQDTGITDNRLCIVKEIPLPADYETVSSQQKDKWDRLVAIQQKLGTYPEIPQIIAYFVDKFHLYIIREYFEGKTLAQQLSNCSFERTEALKLFLDILDVIAFLHSHNLIHGNIQPENIIQLKSNGKYTLFDFDNIHQVTLNEAKLVDNKIATLLINTNSFFSPEQSAGQPIISSDFYSLGKTVIYSLTKSFSAYWQEEKQEREVVQEIEPQFKKILKKTIVPNVNARYHNTREIFQDLSKIENISTIINSGSVDYASENLKMTKINAQSQPAKIPQKNVKSKTKKSKILSILAGMMSLFAMIAIAELVNPYIRPFYFTLKGKQDLIKEPQIALNQFQKAIDTNSKYTDAWQGRGEALFSLKRYRSALLAYDKATELQPRNALAWKGKGDVLFRLERFDAALTAYNQSLQIAPKNPELLNRQGHALYKLERPEEALQAQETALEIKPNYAQALSDRGVALIELGQYQQAFDSFEDAQAIEPLNPEFWQNKALVLQKIGREPAALRLYEEALKAYNKKLQKNPQDVTALINKGNVLVKLKQYSEAIKAYERVIAINQNYHLAWLNKGNVFFALEEYDKALKSIDRALEIAPESYLTWYDRGSLLRDGKQDSQKAIASYEIATEINPNFYHAWRELGVAYSQSGQQNLALKSFQTALEIEPEDYRSLVGRGVAFLALDKIKEACEAYNKAARINSTFSPAIEAIEKLGC
ncbi:Tetratricopeptide repeat protein,protein kinase family protein [Hyella patelloides LEGE 07179]|uniref:Tetratricopeptide repeat protein,protein kinase family protein n=1 Tax=Hyella patelloides LEGE 07179 TaxID=945734 RepID=A0A563VVU7_9CYAN|nr:tetratricopeptide repeat protein [Hyella patelloides]VEP15517.1 Tetratricopeptide repeat protein,protein kinase family protein [Hyella patelloides LEGE 07179]